jgi:cell division initiation protein
VNKVNITPLDLKKQVFRKIMRGYDPVEVRTFLDMVSEEFEKLLKESMHLTERVRTLDSQIADYRNMEQTMNDALLSAQRSLSESREAAQKEAELIIRDARLEAGEIVQEARKECDRLRSEISELEKLRRESIVKLKSFLDGQLGLLTAFEGYERSELKESEQRSSSSG